MCMYIAIIYGVCMYVIMLLYLCMYSYILYHSGKEERPWPIARV